MYMYLSIQDIQYGGNFLNKHNAPYVPHMGTIYSQCLHEKEISYNNTTSMRIGCKSLQVYTENDTAKRCLRGITTYSKRHFVNYIYMHAYEKIHVTRTEISSK